MDFLFNVFLSMIPFGEVALVLVILSFIPMFVAKRKWKPMEKKHHDLVKDTNAILRGFALAILLIGLTSSILDRVNTPKNRVADPEALQRQQQSLNDDKSERASTLELKDNMRPRTRTTEQLKADHEASVSYKN